MAPVGESSSSQVEETEGAQPRHASEADVEISRKGDQSRLENQARSFKQRFSSDLKTAIKILDYYKNDYPSDEGSDASQLQDAQYIMTVFDRLTDRWKNIESLQDDIKVCIFSSVTLDEKEVDKQIEKAEASLEDYANRYIKFKKEQRETLNRVSGYIEKMKRSNNRTSIINNQGNSNPPVNNTAKVLIFKPQPELKPIFLVKDCQLLEFTTWEKNFISYMKSSSLPIPEGSINENLRVNIIHPGMWNCKRKV